MNIEELQALCKSLPAVTEDVKWGHDLVFSIGGKMFIVIGLSETPTTASFKVRDEEFDEMSIREGFMPAPYLARHKWVFINDIRRLNQTEWKKFLNQSYDLVKQKLPSKTKKQLGIM